MSGVCFTFGPVPVPLVLFSGRNPTGGNVRRNLELRNVENYLEEQRVGAHLGDVSGLFGAS